MGTCRHLAGTGWRALEKWVGVGLLGLVLAANAAHAAGGEEPAGATIAVSGSAATAVAPDEASLRFGVEVQRETAAEALQANNELMSAVVRAVRALGVSDDEISTARLTIHPVYERRRQPSGEDHLQVLSGYRVGNALDVRIAAGERVAAIIDAAVNAGANRVEQVAFGMSASVIEAARKRLIAAAVENARDRARQALGALNYHIVGVEAVSLAERPAAGPVHLEAARMDMAASVPPVFAGEQEVRVTVHVTFLIEPD